MKAQQGKKDDLRQFDGIKQSESDAPSESCKKGKRKGELRGLIPISVEGDAGRRL